MIKKLIVWTLPAFFLMGLSLASGCGSDATDSNSGCSGSLPCSVSTNIN